MKNKIIIGLIIIEIIAIILIVTFYINNVYVYSDDFIISKQIGKAKEFVTR